MEIIKYLCEFFFGSFLHWLGLWFLFAALGGGGRTIVERVMR